MGSAPCPAHRLPYPRPNIRPPQQLQGSIVEIPGLHLESRENPCRSGISDQDTRYRKCAIRLSDALLSPPFARSIRINFPMDDSDEIENRNKSLTEYFRHRYEEIQKTPQPISIRLGDLTLTNTEMQRTDKRYIWLCRVGLLPLHLAQGLNQSSKCILTLPNQKIEGVAESLKCIAALPPTEGYLTFYFHSKHLPATSP